MSEAEFNKHIKKLLSISNPQDKIAYLDSVIEVTDYDCNGYNDQLIDIRNELNDQLKN